MCPIPYMSVQIGAFSRVSLQTQKSGACTLLFCHPSYSNKRPDHRLAPLPPSLEGIYRTFRGNSRSISASRHCFSRFATCF
ncbi:hypothetical protein G7K_2324-t1 [Saitoella complicata NRRL Y-17804]|uniref:Uncharacterized protein n=1 Tax=Saitoella complicata (strain BCRC 22490 / CBS 7301 / JCM 7358 / NBRC 10748 / NRRL Y-17804) TaxID=698492 RepID=A0A0E9NE61_SAICN|nr:hypothetical protein G7K_2324-t1 [Saitoella complicata NRRL Y-17804]